MGNSTGKLSGPGSSSGSLGSLRKGVLIRRLMEVIKSDLVRLAKTAVSKGDKFYSVAILRKSDLSLVACGRDKTVSKDPTATAELNAIQGYFSLENRPAPQQCIFLCVHEPSPMALYQLAVCGFDNFAFLFKLDETKALGEDTDLPKLKSIFVGATDDEGYHMANDYWKAYEIQVMIENYDKSQKETVKTIKEQYYEMMTNKESSPLSPGTPGNSGLR